MSSGTEECGDDRFPKSDSEDGPRAMVIPSRDSDPFRSGIKSSSCWAPGAVTAPYACSSGKVSLSPSQPFLFPNDHSWIGRGLGREMS